MTNRAKTTQPDDSDERAARFSEEDPERNMTIIPAAMHAEQTERRVSRGTPSPVGTTKPRDDRSSNNGKS